MDHWVWICVLLCTFSNVRAKTQHELLSFSSMDAAVDEIVQRTSHTNESDFLLLIDETFLWLTNFTLVPPDIRKRWTIESPRIGAWWIEYHTASQGAWWTPWEPASCVHSNRHDSTPLLMHIVRNSTHRARWEAGFNPESGLVSSRILGHETARTNTVSETGWYTLPGYGFGQVWSEQLMIWQEQQRRRCTMYHYGSGGTQCGPWSTKVRGEMPVKNAVNFAWVTDWKKLNFNKCGGDTNGALGKVVYL